MNERRLSSGILKRLGLSLPFDRIPHQGGGIDAGEGLQLDRAGGRGDVDLGQIVADHVDAAIGPVLREKGQVFVGIDVIGDYLTEINVTSPTGIQELERFDGTNTAARIWQVIESKRGMQGG